MKTITGQSLPDRPHPCRIRAGGFTIVELLVALAITSLMLVAVAAALNATAINYSRNEDIFGAINNARQALFRMTSRLRTATAVDPNDPNNQCKCSLVTADGADITYYYNSTDGKLYLITNDNTSDPDYVLCENVSALTFARRTFTEDSVTCVRSVTISITVTVGDTSRTLSAAAVIRKNLS